MSFFSPTLHIYWRRVCTFAGVMFAHLLALTPPPPPHDFFFFFSSSFFQIAIFGGKDQYSGKPLDFRESDGENIPASDLSTPNETGLVGLWSHYLEY